MFDDARFQRLGLREVRYIAPWDVLRDADQREQARRLDGGRARVRQPRRARLPALAALGPARAHAAAAGQFERAFRRVRARYPDVRDWIVWNEANHPFSLTGDRPRRAARTSTRWHGTAAAAGSSPPTCST